MRLSHVALLAAVLAGSPSSAEIFVVDSTDDAVDAADDGVCDADPNPGEAVCTLRAAVQAANALAGLDTIELGAGTYSLDLAGIEEVGAAGDLDVTSSVRIEGAGAGVTVIEQTTTDRVIDVWFDNGQLTLVDLTITGGDVGDNASNLGGGIRNTEVLTLDGVEVTGNRAQVGGGVFNFGIMTATETTIAGNTSTNRSAGLASASFIASGTVETALILTASTIGPNFAASTPTELELANAESATLINVTVSPVSTGSVSVEIGNQDVELVHVTFLGGLATFSHNGSHSLVFTNSAIDRCQATAFPMIISREGVNASTDAGCGFAAAGGVEGPFGLGLLADNGGPTATHLPGDGTLLVGAADAGFCAATDQRGVLRPGPSGCDIGAVEVPEPASALAGGAAAIALGLLRRKAR